MDLLYIFIFVFLVCRTTTSADDYRLPTTVLPSNYELYLTLPEESFTNASDTFEGLVIIQLNVANSTSEIKLHTATATTFHSVQLDDVTVNDTDYTLNSTTNILTISLSSELEANSSHVLQINYTGVLLTSTRSGFYKVSYTDNAGLTHYLVATQLEATYARYGFPCFDEPSFKASFDISITYPSELEALSNEASISNATVDNYTTTVFKTTPIMSTYLVAFLVSNLTCTEGESIEGDGVVPYKVCSRPDYEESREFALEIGPPMLRALNSYTAINYSTTASKMDQAAVPGSTSGAMENWGLIRYGELALIWDKDESTEANKRSIALIIAHEFTHQWFGNLVTCNWWSETFLNEGFARYLESYITNEVLPDWQALDQFVIRIVQTILETDSYVSAQSLQSNASTPSEASAKFGSITYSKGGSILRMVQHIMGLENFRAGLNNYLLTYQYSSTVPEQLWSAIEDAINVTALNLPSDLNTIMANWVQKSGYPLVTAALNGSTLTLSQERFLFSGNDTESKWYVPISYTTSLDSSNFENTLPTAWLTPDGDLEITFESTPEWIVINNQQAGYYRVNYDSTLWDSLASALQQNNFSDIHVLNRAQIINDAFNLLTLGKLKYSEVFRIMEFLKNETSYIVWYPTFNKLDTLVGKVGLNNTLGRAVASHILDLMENLRESVTLTSINTTNNLHTLNQILASTWACNLGNEQCGAEVQVLWQEFKANTSVKPNVNFRSFIYCNGMRYSSNASEDLDFLLDLYQNADSGNSAFLSAIGCSRNESILNEFLQRAITEGSGISTSSAFSAVYGTIGNGVDIAFKFFIDNYDAILTRYNSTSSVGTLLRNIAAKFTTEAQIELLQQYIENGTLNDILTAANTALATAQSNVAWLDDFKADLLSYYGLEETEEETTASTSTSTTTASTPTSTTTASTSTSTTTASTTTASTTSSTTTATTTEAGATDDAKTVKSSLWILLCASLMYNIIVS